MYKQLKHFIGKFFPVWLKIWLKFQPGTWPRKRLRALIGKETPISFYERKAKFTELDDESRRCIKVFFRLARAKRSFSYAWREAKHYQQYPQIWIEESNNKKIRQILFTKKERAKGDKALEALAKLVQSRHLPETRDTSATLMAHGLVGLKPAVLDYIKGKAVIDAGAWVGDSALSFFSYGPSKVYSFEPSEQNAQKYRQVMQANGIAEEQYELIPKGVADKHGWIEFFDTGGTGVSLAPPPATTGTKTLLSRVELVSLDEFWLEKGRPQIGVLKSDIEGGELALLKGAEQTILANQPVLLIAIYHSIGDFLEIYPYLKKLLPDYHWQIRWLDEGIYSVEFYLIGYSQKL